MIDFKNVKLIIWDLDNTLWNGVISDNETVEIKKHFITFIEESLDRGIVHSICSKNEYNKVKDYMENNCIWDNFVFPSINWESKGNRIKNIISNMSLRPENVLFVDDNIQNLNESQYFCKGIIISTPDELENEIENIYLLTKINKQRPRLQQYKILEKKCSAKTNYESNEEFLMDCNIQVHIHNDCMNQIDRIHELILRSNQLNYTKFRQSKESLIELIADKDVISGYVTVTDSYGDYGLVGFFAIKNQTAIHYLFSCRTLGMLIEQYVFMKIGLPNIEIVGDVVTELNNFYIPPWINNESGASKKKKNFDDLKILLKGPCDISQIFSFIEETPNFTTDFTYINDKGISVEGHNHTSQIKTSVLATEEEKDELVKDIPWLDKTMFSNNWNTDYDVIVLSMLTDSALGIYEHKSSGHCLALCEGYYDLTNTDNWDAYINKEIFTSNIEFSKESLSVFSENFNYIDNRDGSVTIDNLSFLHNMISEHTLLILLLGSELEYKDKATPSYKDRHKIHQELNTRITEWAADKSNVYLIKISDYILSQKDYTDTINHFQKKIYYQLAQKIIRVIDTNNSSLKMKSKTFLGIETIKHKMILFIKKIIRHG